MKKIVELYDKLESHILVFALAFSTILIFVQVIFRYVLNNSLTWSEELARYIFIWLIWLGTSISMKSKEHIRMDMLSNALHGKAKVGLDLFSNILMLAFCVFLVIYGWTLVSSMMTRGNLSVALRLPMWIVYLSLPFSQLIVGLRVIGHMVGDIRKLTGREPLDDAADKLAEGKEGNA